jgi:tetratricopeptide (TPR) repeat protein
LGLAYLNLGEEQTAINHFQQTLDISREIREASTEDSPEWTAALRGEGASLGNLGNADFLLGKLQTAIEYHQQARVIHREIGDRRGEANDLGNLGIAYSSLGLVQTAIPYHKQALAMHKEIGDRQGEGADLDDLGNAYFTLGRVKTAIGYYRQALTIFESIGDPRAEVVRETLEALED